MQIKTLTERQREVLDFVRGHIEGHGYAPSVREVSSHLGITGPAAALKHLRALEKKGYLKRPKKGTARGLKVTALAVKDTPFERTRGTVQVPILGEVHAGAFNEAIEEARGHYALDTTLFKCPPGSFILKAKGESMTNAGIDDGDLLLINPSPDASSGDIVVAILEGEATVKRLIKDGRKVILRPENPAMEDMVISGGAFSLAGRVAAIIKRSV